MFTSAGFEKTFEYIDMFKQGLLCTVMLSAFTVIFGFILALVLAMRPEFAEAILSGLKTAELRRCAPVRLSRGMRLFIWVSGALVGEVRLEGWDLDRSADDLAARYWNKSGLCFDDAQAYLEDARRPGVLLVGHPICYAAPRPWHGHTIQNFTYVDEL